MAERQAATALLYLATTAAGAVLAVWTAVNMTRSLISGLAFEMRVLAWSQNLTSARTAEVGVELAASKEDLFATSDFVSIHLALSERTRLLAGRSELDAMKPTAFLVNTSRAAIVDQSALIAALHHERIAGAAILHPNHREHPGVPGRCANTPLAVNR